MTSKEWAAKVRNEATVLSNLAAEREVGLYSWWSAMRNSFERLDELFKVEKFPKD